MAVAPAAAIRNLYAAYFDFWASPPGFLARRGVCRRVNKRCAAWRRVEPIAGQNGNCFPLFSFRKDGENTVKTKISILATAVAVLSLSLYPAKASLLGMPLNLKAAFEARAAQVPACQFYTDDVFAGPVLIKCC